MSKTKVVRARADSKKVRASIKFYYTEKFFNKWMNKYDYPQLNYQQKHYIMKKWWSEGSVACSEVYGIDTNLVDMGEDEIIFTPWAPAGVYNIYDFPTKARAVNTRGVTFINPNDLEIDKDIVIGYCQKNHKSIFSSIECKINEIVDIEMKIRVARKSQSQPWLFTFAPEDYEKVKDLQSAMEDDNPYLFTDLESIESAKALISGATYISDKLIGELEKGVNDVLTMLGCNNVGVQEKKEHLVVDEINANNQDIKEQSDSFGECIKDFFDRVQTCFNKKIDVIDKSIMYNEDNEEEDEEDDETSETN